MSNEQSAFPPVEIRVDIAHMKTCIMQAFSPEAISAAMEVQFDAAFRAFNWEGAVADAVNQVLGEAIQSYFRYGQGRQLVTQTVVGLLNLTLAEKAKEEK